MKEILKKLYKENFISVVNHYDFDQYYYFLDNEKTIFGILKNAMTDNELKLVLSHYELLSEEVFDEENKELFDYLFGKSTIDVPFSQLKYYFIKFLKVKDEETYSELTQLVKESFHETAYFIKKENIYIIVVNKDRDIQFVDILRSIESDFVIQLIGYESDLLEINDALPNYFQFDYHGFQSFNKTNHFIIHKIDLLQNRIFSVIDDKIKINIKQYILKEFFNDMEMLNVVRMYFNTNFNTTLAAKNCYMHRNTFINKIDKFSKQTHFDLRNFDEAFIVYLVIVM